MIVVTIALMAVPADVLAPTIWNCSFGGAVTTLLQQADDLGKYALAVVALVAWSVALAGCAAASLNRRDV